MESAIVSGIVALLVAGAGALISIVQLRREQRKWIKEFKVTWSLDLLRARLASYPDIFRILGRLSHSAPEPTTAQTAGQVAQEINAWIYSAGGMCADATTRGAVLLLRHECKKWARTGAQPSTLYGARNLALRSLRLDLELSGLESYDFDNPASMLDQLGKDLELRRAQ
ncbi:hypothetical protein [Kitasatospora sp. NPDC057015]|uniref:hypothetical protein n=1 Tax=Kitasatospora sp. NPDC057015 TaxID=3346001 RepID=UPI00363DA2FE